MKALPEKKYFKIGEVADLVGVEPHVLRYWETQFPQVRPHKARSGHRLYRRREVETLLVIRELLHVQRFTIAGARQALRQPGGAQSLLPRFFDAAGALTGGADVTTDRGATLVPGPVDVTDEDAVSLFEAPGADSADELVEVEAEGLEDDELRDALDRQAAERAAARAGGRTIVEVEVAPEVRSAPLEHVRSAPLEQVRPMRLPVPATMAAAARAPLALHRAASPAILERRRMLLEEALGSARAVLAILDREDSRTRAQA